MKSFDYEAMAYDASVYCVECLPEGVTREDAYPVFADSEWDYYPTCDACGTVHDYVSLTPDGVLHEAESRNVEIWEETAVSIRNAEAGSWQADRLAEEDGDAEALAGFYWWTCLPGCLPDGEASGPFSTAADAAADALGL